MFLNAKGQFYLSVKDRSTMSTIKRNYSLKAIPSKESNFFLVSRPPAKPVSAPSLPSTL